MKQTFLFLVIGILTFGCAAPQQKAKEDSIGVAEMTKNRTIILQLRAEDAGGTVGEGYFTYAPTDPQYQKILDYVGPLKPGQSTSVRAWPPK